MILYRVRAILFIKVRDKQFLLVNQQIFILVIFLVSITLKCMTYHWNGHCFLHLNFNREFQLFLSILLLINCQMENIECVFQMKHWSGTILAYSWQLSNQNNAFGQFQGIPIYEQKDKSNCTASIDHKFDISLAGLCNASVYITASKCSNPDHLIESSFPC